MCIELRNNVDSILIKILESKRNFRSKLANLPISEKLSMLDSLRERAQVLQEAGRKHRVRTSKLQEYSFKDAK